LSKFANGVVVSAHSLASEAGASILRRGGNAIDAAVATSLMLGVVEPAFSGIGGGGFSLVHLASGETTALDYRETAPGRSKPDMFEQGSDANSIGPLAVATPGAVAGHARLLEEFGTMRFEQVAQPAINTAKSGGAVRNASQSVLKENRIGSLDKVRRFPDSIRLLGAEGGTEALMKLPSLSATLSTLGKRGPESFYAEEIPETISGFLQGMGGILSVEDFQRYAPRARKPVEGELQGLKMFSMPPPSAGGTLMIQGLRALEELHASTRLTDAERFDVIARILRLLLEEKADFGDPEFVSVATNQMLSEKSVRELVDRVSSATTPGRGWQSGVGPGSTSHFCVADRNGNLVSVTETIECYFGSGVAVPDLGIILNDEMHDFDVAPGKPNSVAPGKRPASSMSPTILLKDDSPYIALGGAGSDRIISSIFQVLSNVLDRKMDLAAALAAPRLHPVGGLLRLESGFDAAAIGELKRRSWNVNSISGTDIFFGGVQAIMVDQEKRIVRGCADPRRLGAAASV
jgi:gamma-glutamyltranspeptidase/glutathione hydrolase